MDQIISKRDAYEQACGSIRGKRALFFRPLKAFIRTNSLLAWLRRITLTLPYCNRNNAFKTCFKNWKSYPKSVHKRWKPRLQNLSISGNVADLCTFNRCYLGFTLFLWKQEKIDRSLIDKIWIATKLRVLNIENIWFRWSFNFLDVFYSEARDP